MRAAKLPTLTQRGLLTLHSSTSTASLERREHRLHLCEIHFAMAVRPTEELAFVADQLLGVVQPASAVHSVMSHKVAPG